MEDNVDRMARCHPRRQLQQRMQRIDELHDDLLRGVHGVSKQEDIRLQNLAERLVRVRPSNILKGQEQGLEQIKCQIRDYAKGRMGQLRRETTGMADRLRLLDPQNVVSRGYSITTDTKTGRILRSVKNIRSGQKILTQIADGEIESTVN